MPVLEQPEWVTSARTWTVLTEARWLIARGWVQRDFGYGKAYCLVDALRSVSGPVEDFSAAVRVLGRLIPDRNDLVRWNDRPGRTQAEVLALLDRALSTLEEGRRR